MLYGASGYLHDTQKNPQETAPKDVLAAWLIRRKSPIRILRVLCGAVNFTELAITSSGREQISAGPKPS